MSNLELNQKQIVLNYNGIQATIKFDTVSDLYKQLIANLGPFNKYIAQEVKVIYSERGYPKKDTETTDYETNTSAIKFMFEQRLIDQLSKPLKIHSVEMSRKGLIKQDTKRTILLEQMINENSENELKITITGSNDFRVSAQIEVYNLYGQPTSINEYLKK